MVREPEWDDTSRAEMLGLAEFESGICDCGFHSSLTHNTSNVFSFEIDRCPVCAGRAQYDRLQAKEDREEIEKLGEKASPTAPRPDDGRRVSMVMQPPGRLAPDTA